MTHREQVATKRLREAERREQRWHLRERRYLAALAVSIAAAVVMIGHQARTTEINGEPTIRKLGTLDLDMVETSPVVFRDRLYRFEYVRPGYQANKTGDSYFRFIDVETGKATPAFAQTFDLGCAFADRGSMWVFGVDHWDGENIFVFRSNDLEHWEQRPALKLPGWGLFNTSVCKAGNQYVMAIEVGKPPEVVGVPFTMRFAESKNLLDWSLLPKDCVYTKER
jgi:hypothetical protein